ncbi:MAG: dihydropteroate synthase, partial [Fibromonadales bacterium]|nr:dihydropteroate synthase [Fibromonadales bacterium]
KYNAFEHALKLLDDGADILDIGGESTRPGFTPVSEEEEIARTIPVIEMLAKKQSAKSFQISIDTTKAGVALKAVKAGANIINDVSASLLQTIIDTNSTAVISAPVPNMKKYLLESAEWLEKHGCKNIFIDPGIGFGKTQEENLACIANIDDLCQTKYPVLLGVSRKSFIGKIKGLENSNRLIPSVVCATIAAQKGVKILRVHDVLETKEALVMLDKLLVLQQQ